MIRNLIRKLREADRAQLVALLSTQPAINLYMLGNLEKIGFDTPFCEFWGCFTGNEQTSAELTGVANRYFVGWVVFGLPHTDWQALADLIDAHPAAERLQDNPGGVESIVPFLRRAQVRETSIAEIMQLDTRDFQPQPAPAGVHIRRATTADLDALAAFFSHAGSMARTRAGVERPLLDTTLFFAEEQPDPATGRPPAILSTALTNAETASLAMIGGVYTPPAQRGRGLARAVTSALCAHLIQRAIIPVLYWHEPSAGHVYRTLGFHPIGAWRALVLAPRQPNEL